MGDPKFSRRKYEGPRHPWEGARIKDEAELLKKYGLKNKRELWKAKSLLREFRQRARILQAQVRYGEKQAEKEKGELITKLARIGLLKENATLDDVLALDVDSVLRRRLQSITLKKGLAYSHLQARQLIVHGHISIQGRRVTIPSYLVKRQEEESLEYNPSSPLMNDMHPARPTPEAQMQIQQAEESAQSGKTEER
jgi:small subunit ribosomal protein S4